jgi:hypothetical protein
MGLGPKSPLTNLDIGMSRLTDELNERQSEGMQGPGRLRSLNQERPSTYGLVDQVSDISHFISNIC